MNDFVTPHIPQVMSGLLVFLGAWIVAVPRTSLGTPSIRMDSFSPLVQARLRAGLQRRACHERVPAMVIRGAGFIALLCGVLAFVGVIPPRVAFALFTIVGAPILAYGFLRSYNAARTRVALLAPRRSHIFPLWQLVLYVLFSCVPLAVPFVMRDYATGAVLASVGAFVALACSCIITGSPAILSDDDTPVDEFIDNRLRAMRARQCAWLGVMSVYIFVFLLKLQYPHEPGLEVLQAISIAGFFVAIIGVNRISMPPTSAEVAKWF